MKKNITEVYYTPIQLKLPVDFEKIIEIDDPVYSFNEVMNHIDLQKYFVVKDYKKGRPGYDRVKLLKIVLFAVMEFGYCSVRQIRKLCKTDIRFMWLLDDEEAPSHMTIQNFIHDELSVSLEEIFHDINSYIFAKESVDLQHAYIDGTKIEANANKYTWVWKKSCLKLAVFTAPQTVEEALFCVKQDRASLLIETSRASSYHILKASQALWPCRAGCAGP